MLKAEKGITLVALVVTIIVLLILASVSISLVLGDNGIITRAREASTKTTEAQVHENAQYDNFTNYVNQLINEGLVNE